MTPSPEKFLRARITQRQDVLADRWAIGVDPGGEFRFTAGQYATLGVETPHKLIERPYSIVSSQYGRQVEFFIELVPRGELSPLLYDCALAILCSSVRPPRAGSRSTPRAAAPAICCSAP